MDCAVEVFCVGEGLMGEIISFEVAPNGFDVVEFGRVFGQPLDARPMGAGGERGLPADVLRNLAVAPRKSWPVRATRL